MLRRAANAIRNTLRRWLGVIDPPAALVNDRLDPHAGAGTLLARAGDRFLGRKFEAPKLFPGVVPDNYAYSVTDDPGQLGPYIALDSELVAPSYGFANTFNAGLGFPGYAYLAELSQRSEYRAPAETIASEMTREWIKLTVKGKARKKDRAALQQKPDDAASDAVIKDSGLEDKLEELEEDLEKFAVREAFRKCAEFSDLFGRAQLFIDIDNGGRNDDEINQLPLVIDAATIKKDSLRNLKFIEPIWTTPYTYNATNPTSKDFYVPRAWYVMGRRIHASRLLTFVMHEVPDMLKPAYNFGGLSMTQLMEPYVFQWLRTRNSVSDLIHNFSVMVLKTDMTNALGGDATSGKSLFDRMALFIANRDNQGLTVLDKDAEDMVMLNVPLGGLEGLLSQAQRMQSSPSHIPLVKLIGEAASGLNASDEGAIKIFYDYVRATQQRFYGAPLKAVLQLLQLNRYGTVDDAIGFEFVPLSAPTVKELAEIRKSTAETDATYIDKGVVSQEEVREKLSSDPNSGYNNLDPDELPEVPELVGMEAEHQLGEKSAETAHVRGEESAQAAHERQLEAQKKEKATT